MVQDSDIGSEGNIYTRKVALNANNTKISYSGAFRPLRKGEYGRVRFDRRGHFDSLDKMSATIICIASIP